jgi:hypothetical protein
LVSFYLGVPKTCISESPTAPVLPLTPVTVILTELVTLAGNVYVVAAPFLFRGPTVMLVPSLKANVALVMLSFRLGRS